MIFRLFLPQFKGIALQRINIFDKFFIKNSISNFNKYNSLYAPIADWNYTSIFSQKLFLEAETKISQKFGIFYENWAELGTNSSTEKGIVTNKEKYISFLLNYEQVPSIILRIYSCCILWVCLLRRINK